MDISKSKRLWHQPFRDIHTARAFAPVVFPRILGIECIGVVEATTSPTLTVGQTVVSLMGEMGRAFDGSYAEYTLLRLGYNAIITDTDNTLATKECFDKILELVGPASIKDSFAHIKEYGIICATGLLGGKWYLEDFDPTRDLLHNAYLLPSIQVA